MERLLYKVCKIIVVLILFICLSSGPVWSGQDKALLEHGDRHLLEWGHHGQRLQGPRVLPGQFVRAHLVQQLDEPVHEHMLRPEFR